MAFMRERGVLKDVYKESSSESHRTARGKEMTVPTSKAPGFGPVGIMRYVLPITVFVKLKDIDPDVLPPYEETFVSVPMTPAQADAYKRMQTSLVAELKRALVYHDNSLLGVVMNVLLAWPDCAFRTETVKHPRTKGTLHFQPAIFAEPDVAPKEKELLRICKEEKAKGREVLAYSIYSGTRDTAARLKSVLQQEGLKVAVLRASVDAGHREETQGVDARWHVAMRSGKRRVLDDRQTPLGALLDEFEHLKASVRAKMGHPFRVLKRQFGYTKVRYRGLANNTTQLTTLFALANLWLVRRKLLGAMRG